jgi:hypothetical protein
VAGRAAKDHLPQTILGVGAFYEEIAAFCRRRAEDCFAGDDYEKITAMRSSFLTA